MTDPAAPPRFRPLADLACEACRAALLPYDPAAGDVRVLALHGAALRAFCSPRCAAPAGWPWLARKAA